MLDADKPLDSPPIARLQGCSELVHALADGHTPQVKSERNMMATDCLAYALVRGGNERLFTQMSICVSSNIVL